MTKEEVKALTFILNNKGNSLVKVIFEEIFLIDSVRTVRGFNKVALREYARQYDEKINKEKNNETISS